MLTTSGCFLLDRDLGEGPFFEGWALDVPPADEYEYEYESESESESGPATNIDVEPCAGDLDPEDISRNLELASTFTLRVAELDVFSEELRRLARELDAGSGLLADPSTSALPEGYVGEGEGVIALELESFDEARMEVRFFLARNYSFGAEGDLVTADPFLLSSYLLEPVVTRPNNTVAIAHAGAGPLAELLGYGVEPPNPLVFASSEETTFGDARLELMLEANVRLADASTESSVAYQVKVPRRTARSVQKGDPVSLHVVEASGHREDLAQGLVVDRWTLSRVAEPRGLKGEIDVEVRGGYFDFITQYTYEAATEPDQRIRCAW